MHKILFYIKFFIFLYMFRALRAYHQGSKLYYTASGIITLCMLPSGAPGNVFYHSEVTSNLTRSLYTNMKLK